MRNRLSVYVPGTGWADLDLTGTGSQYPVAREIRNDDSILHVPKGVPVEVSSGRNGWEFEIEARYIQDTVVDGLDYQDYIYGIFRDANGGYRNVDVCLWEDEGTGGRIYRNCVAPSIEFGSAVSESSRPYSISIQSHDPDVYAEGRNSDTPPEHTQEIYVVNGLPGGGAPELDVQYTTKMTIVFDGRVQAASATNVSSSSTHTGTVDGPDGATMVLERVEITGARIDPGGSSGNLGVRFSDTDYASAGNGITATITYAQSAGSNTGTVNFTAGDTWYCYVTDASGKHSSVVVHAHFRRT